MGKLAALCAVSDNHGRHKKDRLAACVFRRSLLGNSTDKQPVFQLVLKLGCSWFRPWIPKATVSPLGKSAAIHGALGERVSHRFICLNTWFPVAGSVQEELGGVAWRRRCVMGWTLWFQKTGGGGHPQYASLPPTAAVMDSSAPKQSSLLNVL